MEIKKIFVKLLAFIFRKSFKAKNAASRKLGFVSSLLKIIGSVFFNLFIFPIFKFSYYSKYKLLRIYAPAKSKVFYFITRSYLIHIIIAAIALIVVANNIRAEEIRQENYGEKTIIYTIITKEEYEELTEETGISIPQEEILSYLDKSVVMESLKTVVEDVEFGEGIVGDINMMQGGSAILKPNINRPIELERSDAGPVRGSKIIIYVVKESDTISSIAKKFNVSVDTVLWQNNLSPRSIIKAGNKLEILPITGVVHNIKKGETVGAIARKYSIDEKKIISANNLMDATDIQIGQQLVIPGGKKITPVITSKTYAKGVTPQISPISKLFENVDKERASASGYVWPASVRRITQYFSWRHKGLDVAGPVGTNVYAMDDGTVERSGWITGYGYNVVINHGNGIKTLYGHSSKLYVSKGDKVVKGQIIMAMGSTGWSTGPHVHFEVRVNGVYKNPLSYVK